MSSGRRVSTTIEAMLGCERHCWSTWVPIQPVVPVRMTFIGAKGWLLIPRVFVQTLLAIGLICPEMHLPYTGWHGHGARLTSDRAVPYGSFGSHAGSRPKSEDVVLYSQPLARLRQGGDGLPRTPLSRASIALTALSAMTRYNFRPERVLPKGIIHDHPSMAIIDRGNWTMRSDAQTFSCFAVFQSRGLQSMPLAHKYAIW